MTDILIGRHDSASVCLDPHYGNRHDMIESASRAAGSRLGQQIVRGALRGIFGGKR